MEGQPQSQETLDLSNQGLRSLTQCNPTSLSIVSLIVDNNHLSSLEGLVKFPHLIQLSARVNRLIDMKGVADLSHLVMINLQNNSITTIQRLDCLHRLQWLCLAGNSIKDPSGVSACTSLSHLDLSDNFIKVLPDLSKLTVLKTLLFHGNCIKTLTNLHRIPAVLPPSIQILTLAENGISDLNEFSSLSSLKSLQQLSVMGNAATSPGGVVNENTVDYRCYILYWCPHLIVLDGTSTTDKERMQSKTLFTSRTHCPFSLGQHKELLQYLSTRQESRLQDEPHPQIMSSLPVKPSFFPPPNKENLSPNHTPLQSLTASLAEGSSKPHVLETLKALRYVQQMISAQENLLLQHSSPTTRQLVTRELGKLEGQDDEGTLSRTGQTSLSSLTESQVVNEELTHTQFQKPVKHELHTNSIVETFPKSAWEDTGVESHYHPFESCDTLAKSHDNISSNDTEVGSSTINGSSGYLFTSHDPHVTSHMTAKDNGNLLVEDLEELDINKVDRVGVATGIQSPLTINDPDKGITDDIIRLPDTPLTHGDKDTGGELLQSTSSYFPIVDANEPLSSAVSPSALATSLAQAYGFTTSTTNNTSQLMASLLSSTVITSVTPTATTNGHLPHPVTSITSLNTDITQNVQSSYNGLSPVTTPTNSIVNTPTKTIPASSPIVFKTTPSNSPLSRDRIRQSLIPILTQKTSPCSYKGACRPSSVPGNVQKGQLPEGRTKEQVLEAAILIQSVYRGYLCRRKKLLVQHKAAIVIQATWRGYYARSYDPMVRYIIKELYRKKLEGYMMFMFLQLQGCREELAHQVHTVQIQEEALQSLLCEVEELHQLKRDEIKKQRNIAAKVIQRYWRNYKARKNATGLTGFMRSPLISLCISLQCQVKNLQNVTDGLSMKLEQYLTEKTATVLPVPLNLSMSHYSCTCLLIQWDSPTTSWTHPPLMGYKIYINGEVEGMISPGKNKAYIEGLDLALSYRITVRALYEGGVESQDSNPVMASLSQPFSGNIEVGSTSEVGGCGSDLKRKAHFMATKSDGDSTPVKSDPRNTPSPVDATSSPVSSYPASSLQATPIQTKTPPTLQKSPSQPKKVSFYDLKDVVQDSEKLSVNDLQERDSLSSPPLLSLSPSSPLLPPSSQPLSSLPTSSQPPSSSPSLLSPTSSLAMSTMLPSIYNSISKPTPISSEPIMTGIVPCSLGNAVTGTFPLPQGDTTTDPILMAKAMPSSQKKLMTPSPQRDIMTGVIPSDISTLKESQVYKNVDIKVNTVCGSITADINVIPTNNTNSDITTNQINTASLLDQNLANEEGTIGPLMASLSSSIQPREVTPDEAIKQPATLPNKFSETVRSDSQLQLADKKRLYQPSFYISSEPSCSTNLVCVSDPTVHSSSLYKQSFYCSSDPMSILDQN